MREGETPPFGEKEANRILNAGWRQGSPCQPPEDLAPGVSYDAKTEWLVVLSQSCNVVSQSISDYPLIEVVVAKPNAKFHAKSPEATGKNGRKFQLPVSGISGVEALECDINRRFSIPRQSFLEFTPPVGVTVSARDARNLAGWISRYYTRIALPNELVHRAKIKGGLFEIIKKALDQKVTSGEPLHHRSDAIYVQFEPDEELASGTLYRMALLFLSDNREAADKLGDQLSTQLYPFTKAGGHDGIYLEFESNLTSQTLLSDVDAYSRLSEWDYLSNLGDVAAAQDKLPG
jgi:hypothetical protein